MAAAAIQHEHSAAGAHAQDGHGSGHMGGVDCEDAEAVTSDAAHEDCDCSEAGCQCACGFITLALARGVPAIDPVWLGYLQTNPTAMTVAQRARSSVFRPPIG